jgi:hypothetical protein
MLETLGFLHFRTAKFVDDAPNSWPRAIAVCEPDRKDDQVAAVDFQP